MFKKCALCWTAVLFLVCAAAAEVGVLSVTDEDKHSKKEDFWHTFEYYISAPSGQTSKCQATRIAKNWFATAGHCVAELCKQACTLRMDLLEQPVSAFVRAEHTAQKPVVFLHPDYGPAELVKHDFALLHMDITSLPAQYYRRPQGGEKQGTAISRKTFNAYLTQHPAARRELNRIMHPELPAILVFDEATRRIDRKLSVISIFDGKRRILPNPYPTDYVKQLGFAYTQNFGIRQGISGSGVMTNTGELAGVVSAYLGATSGGQKRQEYFMFAVFNADLLEFMEDVMGSDYYKLDRKDAYPHYVTKSPADHQTVLRLVRRLAEKQQK